MNAVDAWIEALPEGRNERCPCGCGQKMKKIYDDPEPHFKQFAENLKARSNES